MAVNVEHFPTRFPGFWSPSTATLDWCEENYHHTPFIAEFWNTLSNLGFIAGGAIGAAQFWKIRRAIPVRYVWTFIWMAVIGIGSLLFHATLLYSMQLLDEIPMLFSNSQMLYILWHPDLDLKMVRRLPKWFRKSPVGYFGFSVAITALYVCNPASTLFFQVSYGTMILLMAISLHMYALQLASAQSVKSLLNRAAIFMIFAFAIWNVDNLMCEKLRSLRNDYLPAVLGPLMQFHAWWHILTMISGTHTIIAVAMAWCKTNPKILEKEGIVWNLGAHFNGILPWLHFKTTSTNRPPLSVPLVLVLVVIIGMESGNLVHLEEYVDTIISLPHEIQRNLTLIKEHDAKVQDVEASLFVDIEEFMSLQSKKRQLPDEQRIELIKRIKNSFLSTLVHCEEKVSLSNQCYNSVEKHLVKMEEDLKCFEEEIRLSGYADLLEKVAKERKRQQEQVRNKKRQEALLSSEAGSDNGGDETSDSEDSDSSAEPQQQQQQQQFQKKNNRKPSNNRNASNPANRARASRPSAAVVVKKNESDDDNGEVFTKVSRAERLLRRNKPNFVNEVNGAADSSSGVADDKEDAIDNQGDDEAEESEREREDEDEDEDGEEGEREGENDEKEREISDSEKESATHESQGVESEKQESPPRNSRRQPTKPNTIPGSSEPLYCTCHRVSFGQMIACDAKDCPVEWFHYECVGLKGQPKGKWFCRGCQEAMDAKTAAQLAAASGSGMSTRSSRRTQ